MSPEEISVLSDIPLDVNLELDRRVMTVRELLNLDSGSIVRLNRSAGENIDVIVGDALIGFGEIVIIEDRMGVRITTFNVEE
jgi:flagellar motor switch protein FliN/FliY